MAKLETWQRKHWLRARAKRLKWQEKHPARTYGFKDPYELMYSRYDCALCSERFYYTSSGFDKDVPQYHKQKKVWLTICHACWHLKGIYKKHQEARTSFGLSGCRICELQLAAKRNRKRSVRRTEEEDTSYKARPRVAEPSAADWEPTRVRRSVGLSSGRVHRKDVSGKRLAGRGAG
jgi:hypothetical protein